MPGASPQDTTIVAQDVSPGLALLDGRSPAGRHTGSDVVGDEVPSLKGLIVVVDTNQPVRRNDHIQLSSCPERARRAKQSYSIIVMPGASPQGTTIVAQDVSPGLTF
jgi:hypothetical protein